MNDTLTGIFWIVVGITLLLLDIWGSAYLNYLYANGWQMIPTFLTGLLIGGLGLYLTYIGYCFICD